MHNASQNSCHENYSTQGLVKGEKFCFRNLNFYFRHGESTSTASQKSKENSIFFGSFGLQKGAKNAIFV